MATCDYCSSTILFGGIQDQGYRFCNAQCQQKAQLLNVNQPSLGEIEAEASAIHRGACPQCSGPGPVDVHTSHRVMSFLLFTSWNSQPHLCCRSCGRKAQIKDLLLSLGLGWWGFPWGLVITPIQILRNLEGLVRNLDPTQPSAELRRLVRNHLSQTRAAQAFSANSPPAYGYGVTAQPNRRNGVSKLLQWAMVGFTGLFLILPLTEGEILPLLCLAAALVVILPPLESFVHTKLPLLKRGLVRWLAWFVLWMTALVLSGQALFGMSDVALCTQPQQGSCTSDVKNLFSANNPQTLYVSATPQNIPDGTEFKLALASKSGANSANEIDRTTAKAKVQDGKLLLSLAPKALTAGTYELSVASDNKKFTTQTKSFKVWDGQLKGLTLCTEPQQGQCQNPVSALVSQTPKLYVAASSEHLKAGMPLKWELTYTPEVGKTSLFDSKTTPAIVQDNRVLLEIAPKALPVGTYQLSLAGNPTVLASEVKEFTVWDTAQDAEARLNNTLPTTATTLGSLKLCDRTGKPEPKDDEIKQIDPVFCPSNATQFKSSTKAIGFQLGLNSVVDKTAIKITWKFLGSDSIQPHTQHSTKYLNSKTAQLDFTLSSPSGFPPGNYELILGLETKNAKPIYRQFTVQ